MEEFSKLEAQFLARFDGNIRKMEENLRKMDKIGMIMDNNTKLLQKLLELVGVPKSHQLPLTREVPLADGVSPPILTEDKREGGGSYASDFEGSSNLEIENKGDNVFDKMTDLKRDKETVVEQVFDECPHIEENEVLVGFGFANKFQSRCSNLGKVTERKIEENSCHYEKRASLSLNPRDDMNNFSNLKAPMMIDSPLLSGVSKIGHQYELFDESSERDSVLQLQMSDDWKFCDTGQELKFQMSGNNNWWDTGQKVKDYGFQLLYTISFYPIVDDAFHCFMNGHNSDYLRVMWRQHKYDIAWSVVVVQGDNILLELQQVVLDEIVKDSLFGSACDFGIANTLLMQGMVYAKVTGACAKVAHINVRVSLIDSMVPTHSNEEASELQSVQVVHVPVMKLKLHGISTDLYASVFDEEVFSSIWVDGVHLQLFVSSVAKFFWTDWPKPTTRSKDMIYLTTLGDELVRKGEMNVALDLFRELHVKTMKLNEVAIVCILYASTQWGALELGKWVRSHVEKYNINLNHVVGSALVNMLLLWGLCSDQLQILHVNEGKKVLLIKKDLHKEQLVLHCWHEPDTLIYNSLLEQQFKKWYIKKVVKALMQFFIQFGKLFKASFNIAMLGHIMDYAEKIQFLGNGIATVSARLSSKCKALTEEVFNYINDQVNFLELKDGSAFLDNFRRILKLEMDDDRKKIRFFDILDWNVPLAYKEAKLEEFCAAAISTYWLTTVEYWEHIASIAFECSKQEERSVNSVEYLAQDASLSHNLSLISAVTLVYDPGGCTFHVSERVQSTAVSESVLYCVGGLGGVHLRSLSSSSKIFHIGKCKYRGGNVVTCLMA